MVWCFVYVAALEDVRRRSIDISGLNNDIDCLKKDHATAIEKLEKIIEQLERDSNLQLQELQQQLNEVSSRNSELEGR